LDGQLARRLGQASALGSRLDAIADAAVNASALGWLYLLRPEVVRDHVVLIVPLIALGAAAIAVGWIRFGRIADLHLPSGRAMAVAGYLFLVNLFLFDTYSRVLFFTMMFLAWIVASEALYVFCTRRNLDERVSSPLLSSLSGLLGGRHRARSPY
jgi:phosphatidylglycerophosphate synthase